MTVLKSFMIVLLAFYGCKTVNHSTENFACDYQKASRLAKNKMQAVTDKDVLGIYNVTEIVDSDYYIFEYLPKDIRHPGGGGKFRVNRNTCQISFQYYQ
ncbi:MAG TPA: hypothetical protein VIN07_11715 [Flavipsychrobacter sp.]